METNGTTCCYNTVYLYYQPCGEDNLIFFLFFHFRMNSFKESMPSLRQLDMMTYFCLCIHLVMNLMRSVSYIYNLHDDELMVSIEEIFSNCQEIVSPLWYLILNLLGKKLLDKIKNKKKSKIDWTNINCNNVGFIKWPYTVNPLKRTPAV